MSKYWTIDIECPHCRLKQRHIVSKHMEVCTKPQRIMCWNSDQQEGCKQPFDLTLTIHMTTMKIFPEAQKEAML